MAYPDNQSANFGPREVGSNVHSLLADRWSPRAFKKSRILDEDIITLFEAARVSPSCFNDQPWRFFVSNDNNFDECLALLVEANQAWAKNASLIGFVVCTKHFDHNGKQNHYAEFDAGAAWMSLTVQARAMGLYTHGMGGIKHEEVAKYFGIGEELKVLCGFTVGVRGDAEDLPEKYAAMESPSPRKPLSDILHR